jgi:hypothetical protein
VRLEVAGPSDQASTLAGAVAVRGTVSPANATVLVEGRPASVRRGSFSAQVSLVPGTNVIDVLAGAPHAAGSATAIRVYRQIPVSVPDLSGANPSRAVAQLTRLGLRPEVVDTGGFYQSLNPTSTQDSSTSPAPGATLAPGSGIQVQVAKVC